MNFPERKNLVRPPARGKVKEKLNYMHANPVIRKLVKHPKDWAWSSWSDYMRDEPGLIAIDAVL
jgi:hypothetical protein